MADDSKPSGPPGDKLDPRPWGKDTLSVDVSFGGDDDDSDADVGVLDTLAGSPHDTVTDPPRRGLAWPPPPTTRPGDLALDETLVPDATLAGDTDATAALLDAPTATLGGAGALPYTPGEEIGTLDEFVLLRELGAGGMGVVYLAWSRRLGRRVAIKVVRGGGPDQSPIIARRFVNEAMLAARLNHPNIVKVYTSGEADDGTHYFVMEFVEGRDLGDFLDAGLAPSPRNPMTLGGRGTSSATVTGLVDGKLTVRAAVAMLEKAARALHYAHEQGVVHRDVKPDNILVDSASLEPHLTDFGVAKALVEDAGLTAAGDIMGTPHYMSPEQANGELRAIGPRSDVYSLGATLYHILTGRTPFDADSLMAVLFAVLNQEPAPPSQVAAEHLQPVPLDLETICLKAIEKEAGKRYESAAAFADELRRYLDGEPILARPLSTGERLRRRLQRNRATLVATFVVVSLLFTLLVAFGVTVFSTVGRTSDSLRALDQAEALNQAETLEQAIVVNMLQGRADLARALVAGLEDNPDLGGVTVARLDRTPAYTDASTRRQVEARLSKAGYLDEVRRRHPEMLDEVEELQRRALPNIDAQDMPVSVEPIDIDDAAWRKALTGETTTWEDTASNELVVLKPILNRDECTVCHGDGGLYDDGRIRAMLVVRRSLEPVERLVAENTRTTWMVGGITVLVLLALTWICARVFGIGLPERHFGANRKRPRRQDVTT